MTARYILSPALLSLLLATSLAAQEPASSTRILHGSVRDEDTGEPITGATVRLVMLGRDGARQTTPSGAMTRSDGTFTLLIQPGPAERLRIEINSVGYDPLAIPLEEGADTLVLALHPRAAMQGEVEVIAVRRTRSVEDACCRVESIQEEVQQHAPFAPTAGDVLRRYSSCTSTRHNCSIGDASSIRLRGLEPTNVRVLVDGLPAFSGLSTFYGLGMIPSGALQTIRISEGASSGRYGNGAIAGVVDLETRPPTEVPELMISGNLAGEEAGSPDAQDAGASFTGMVGGVGIAAFGSYQAHTSGELYRFGAPAIHHRQRRGSGMVKGNVMLDDATELTVTAMGGASSDTSRYSADFDSFREYVMLQRLDLSAKAAHSFSEDAELTVAGLFSTFAIDALFGASPLDATQRTGYATASYAGRFGGHDLLLGVELRNDRLAERSAMGIGYEVTIPSLYLQDEVTLSEQWGVLGSVRVDHHSSAGTIVSPRGSIRFEPVANLPMRLMVGTGFKGEALFDEEHLVLHGVYAWRPNPAFGFERSLTVNYDVSYRFTIGEVAGLDANFNAYHTTITGKAVPQPDSLDRSVLYYVNSEKPARLAGIELQLRPSFGEHWSGSFALALISYAMKNGDGIYEQVPLAPRSNLDVSLMYRNDDLGLIVEGWGSHIGSQRVPSDGTYMSSPSYSIANIRAEKRFGGFSVFGGVTNMFDERQTALLAVGVDRSRGLDTGRIWGELEGREMFLGVRYVWSGGEEEGR